MLFWGTKNQIFLEIFGISNAVCDLGYSSKNSNRYQMHVFNMSQTQTDNIPTILMGSCKHSNQDHK